MATPNSKKIIFIIFFFLFVGSGGLFLLLRFGSNSPKTIPYTQATKFVGQKKTVTGTIETVFNNRSAVYLDFGNPHEPGVKLFRIKIPKTSWPNFPKAPEEIYHAGDKITVTGKIEWYQGDPVISVLSPDHIQIVT